MKAVILDSTVSNLGEDGYIYLTNNGLYKLDVITDIQGNYSEGSIEIIVMNSEGVETIIKKHNLNESLLNTIVKSFDGNEVIKVKVYNNDIDKEFTFRTTLIVDKIY